MVLHKSTNGSVVLFDRYGNKITNIGTIADIMKKRVSDIQSLDVGTYISTSGVIFVRKEKKQ